MKMELLKAINKKQKSKTGSCKDFGIDNSTLSIMKKNDQITVKRKRMKTAKHENLETALLVRFKEAMPQNAPILEEHIGKDYTVLLPRYF
ncbi:hypothetical protein QE152_g22285 [Popillia japonica]|uniref:HTH psq-type domain-containing protein n=1 Tax=Popillia japonica TaxID=7064 RepID=A0AAW1KLD1_POPJA